MDIEQKEEINTNIDIVFEKLEEASQLLEKTSKICVGCMGVNFDLLIMQQK